MKKRLALLFVVPAVFVGAYTVVRIGAGSDPEALRITYTLFPLLSTALAFFGCTAAAQQFERGDFLRLAWYLQAFGYLCLSASAVWRTFGPAATVVPVRSALTLLSNSAQVVGTILFARTWLVAGIELPGTRFSRRGVIAGAILVAVLTAGLPLALSVSNLLHGRASALIALCSSLGDMISLCLLAPILLTALALRGGIVAWPWTFWTLTMLSWLLFDAQDSIGYFWVGPVQDNPEVLRAAFEPFKICACSFTFAAGMVQRWISAGHHAPESQGMVTT